MISLTIYFMFLPKKKKNNLFHVKSSNNYNSFTMTILNAQHSGVLPTQDSPNSHCFEQNLSSYKLPKTESTTKQYSKN